VLSSISELQSPDAVNQINPTRLKKACKGKFVQQFENVEVRGRGQATRPYKNTSKI
jgi:hypothetical protein